MPKSTITGEWFAMKTPVATVLQTFTSVDDQARQRNAKLLPLSITELIARSKDAKQSKPIHHLSKDRV
jgi:hypothetical protein